MHRRRLRLSLTQQVALLSLIPMVALGFLLARVLESQIVTRTLADEDEAAQLIAHLAIQPRLSPQDLRTGLDAKGIKALDEQLSGRSVTRDLARIKIWNANDRVIYSDLHRLIGHTFPASDDLEAALAGRPGDASAVTPALHTETASEVGLGKLVEAYVPLRFTASSRPEGAFEIYLSYRPIAAAISRDKRTIALLVSIGLALLWAILFRIVARASRRLRRQAEENYFLARHDQLTGLPNRTLLIERLTETLEHEQRDQGATAVLRIDLDGFGEINNTLGTLIGDKVLCEVGQRLQADLPDDALVARLGADEYAVLCPRTSGAAGGLASAATVQASLESPIVLEGVALNIEASIGIAVMGEHADGLDTLLLRADVALARARSQHSRVEVYSPTHDTFDPTRLMLLGQVRAGLERGEFILHYQPKIDLETKRISGVEALLRWRHPEQGLLPPLRFIPLIEQTALVGPVTLHVITMALRQMSSWRKLGLRLGLSLNLSARNLLDAELPAQVERLLAEYDVPADQLTVEVTESATLADPERAVRVLSALRATGVAVSIDDFGTGNASIDYLARLPASEIKIDKSFITHICDDERAEAIVRSTIDLARHLQLNVVAEGIETQDVLDRLSTLGCDTGQGYVISHPLPGEQLTERLLADLQAASPDAPSAAEREAPRPRAVARPARVPAATRHRSSAR
jgi:diguanylate cyclase (GGDEF)-like protein